MRRCFFCRDKQTRRRDSGLIVDELLRADNGQRPATSAVLDAVLDLRAAVRAGTRKVEQMLTPEQRAALEAVPTRLGKIFALQPRPPAISLDATRNVL